METAYSEAARRLWQLSPWWRGSVIAAAVFTILFVVYVVAGPAGETPSVRLWPSSRTPAPAPPKPDPAAEVRLAEYENAYRAATAEAKPGLRCEQIGSAFDRLDSSDVASGRSVLFSTTARLKSLSDGQYCHDSLISSDERFDALDRVIAQAGDDPAGTACNEVSSAFAHLSVFDRSRARFARESDSVSTAGTIAAKCQDSDRRLVGLTQAVARLKISHSAFSFTAAADSSHLLTDFDRGRATSQQKRLISEADQAGDTIADSHSRIAQLSGLVSAASGIADTQAAEALFRATSSISPFDEEAASPAENALISQARDRTATLAWASLRTRLSMLDRAPERAASYPPVIEVYKVAIHDRHPLTEEQKNLLARGAAAAEVIASSDSRLQRLMDAASAWRERGVASKALVTDARNAITAFDRDRFDDAHQVASGVLDQADAVIHGPALGLKNAGQGRTAIYVFASASDGWNVPVANALKHQLREERYAISETRDGAALLLRVEVESLSDPELVIDDTQMAHQVSAAEIRIVGRWTVDDSLLVDDSLKGSGEGQGDATAIQKLALRDAVMKAVADLKRLTCNR